jgi:poly(A) polymerase
MRTSEEIYHRVRWDPRFDPARFTLGILVRGAPAKRLPLTSFVPGGDIPWHRVLFVEADGEVVWDRAAGVDRLDATTAGRVRERLRLRAPFFTPRPVHGDATAEPGLRLRVLTWNTLWDRYDSDLIDTARRRPLLVEELARADADVIALQEVEPELLAMLAIEGYAVSDGTNIAEHGLVLLSRLPVLEAGHHRLRAHKGVAAMVVRTAFGPVAVLATHLTSDHHPYGPARRVEELARLAVGVAEIHGPVVLLGDFNGGAVDGLGLVDAWSAVRGDDTPTFDPTVNPLAAVSSLTGLAARLDRVLVRGVRPVATELLGTGPVFVSDHYGVVADLAPVSTGTLDVAPTARTAVAWVRERHDPRTQVTVLSEFVPESDFAAAAPLLAEAASLGEALVARFPRCRAVRTPPAGGTFVVLSRRGDEPMRPRMTVEVETGKVRWVPEPKVRTSAADPEPATKVVRHVAEALPHGVVHVVGSRAMGCALAGADLDLVATVPGVVDLDQIVVPGPRRCGRWSAPGCLACGSGSAGWPST